MTKSHRARWCGEAFRISLSAVLIAFALCLGFTVFSMAQAWAAPECGETADCALPAGAYRLLMPDGAPRAIFMFFHGYGSSAAAEAAAPGFREWANAEGVVLVLPDGSGGRWSVVPTQMGIRDDVAFADAVLADARHRFALPDLPVIIGGFSLGASMTWALACAGKPKAGGYVAVSGAFWEPVPLDCRFPSAPLVHFHGTNDAVVPLEGRQVRSGLRQAPLLRAFTKLEHARACASPASWRKEPDAPAELRCAMRSGCGDPTPFYACFHEAGHNFTFAWVSYALRKALPPVR